MTGFTLSSATLGAKRLELLHELIPDLRRVAYLTTPVGPAYNAFEQHVREAATALGLAIFSVPITTEKTVTDGFVIVEREKAQAILSKILHQMCASASALSTNAHSVLFLPSIHGISKCAPVL